MDISKFNQELAYKVAKANGLEKHQRFKEAVKVWIEISEMVISMSKLAKIDFAFRSMLIEKTKQIINHIKDLKRLSSSPVKKLSQETVTRPPARSIEKKIDVSQPKEKITSKSESIPSIQEQKHPDMSGTERNEIKFVESDDVQNMPKGFKEIETSQDFTIITPHDKEYVEKILSQDIDMSVFAPPESHTKPSTKEVTQKSELNGVGLICFACGTELPLGTKICPNCGTKLS